MKQTPATRIEGRSALAGRPFVLAAGRVGIPAGVGVDISRPPIRLSTLRPDPPGRPVGRASNWPEARALEGPQAQAVLLRARSAREILIVPDRKAWWAAFTVDDKGYYWLLSPRAHGEEMVNLARRVRVLSPEGEYLGDTIWPETYVGGNIMKGHFLSVRLDPDTEEWIPTVYRMIPAVDGFSYY